ncbi:MAG: helix-turn-helix transcriptional regulator [Pikeienuella sp.]|uniref:helix-turn-helix transcriptional regulator n=1 Tax=Pikeienuella sp. TaxID=2831957 RepID=UPI003919F14E
MSGAEKTTQRSWSRSDKSLSVGGKRKRERILKNLETAVTWNADEVAAYLGCHVATVWRKVHSGDLPKPIKIVGRTVWRRAEIEALIEGAE